jgi:uncharacterized sodium:solute symporter family permease YidK
MNATTGNTVFKKAFKAIVTFSAVFGFAASIWLVSAYFTKKDSSAVVVSDKVEIVIKNQKDDRIIVDTILLKLNGLQVLQSNMDKLNRNQQNLTNAVENFIRNNRLATKEDLDNFVQELKKK